MNPYQSPRCERTAHDSRFPSEPQRAVLAECVFGSGMGMLILLPYVTLPAWPGLFQQAVRVAFVLFFWTGAMSATALLAVWFAKRLGRK